MISKLRNELSQKGVTIWEELCAIICCERSRTYLNFILDRFDAAEKAYTEKKLLEEIAAEEER